MPASAGRGASIALALAVLAAVGGLWLRFHATPPDHGTVYPSDLLNYFYPLAAQAAGRLARGELPLWNPYACSGIPLLATLQVGVFYPGNWPSVWVGADRLLPARLFVECFLGGWFVALLLRRWGLRSVACVVGGILFPYACLIGQTFWPPAVATLVWMPWTLLCIEALSQRWLWRWWIGLAAGTALQLVAGFPQFAVYTFALAGPYALLRTLGPGAGQGRRQGLRCLLGMAGATALGVGLAGVQLGPTLELVANGVRRGGVDPAEAHYLKAVASGTHFLANALDPSPKLAAFDYGRGAGYLGIATLILAAVGLVAGRLRAQVWLFSATIVVGFVLSLGFEGPTAWLYEVYASLPGLGWFRVPERHRVLVLFSVIALAGLGFDAVARGLPGGRRRAGAAAALLASLGIFAAGPTPVRGLTLASLLLVALCSRASAREPVRRGLAAALLVLLAGDVIHATATAGSLRSFPSSWSEVYHTAGTTLLDGGEVARLRRTLGLQRAAILGVQPFMPAPPILGLQRVSCYEPLAPEPWPDLTRLARRRTGTGRFVDELSPLMFGAFYDAAGVRTVLAPNAGSGTWLQDRQRRWLGRGGSNVPVRDPGRWIEQLENADALPRAYLIGRHRVVSRPQALGHVARGDVDLRSVVLLDRDPGLPPGSRSGAAPRPASITDYAPERVEMIAETESAAILVLTDTDYPGWRARVDGADTPILRANGMYRAVAVPAGRHRVVFEYRPRSLRWGAAGSAFSLALLVALPGVDRLRRSPGRRASDPAALGPVPQSSR